MIEQILTVGFFIGLLSATVRLSAPVLLAALGETMSQRSGVFNLGIEGIMTLGAFGGFFGAYFTHNLWIGVMVGSIFGGLMGLFNSFMCVTLRANQPITGIMIRILCWSSVAYFIRVFFGGTYVQSPVQFKAVSIPVLSQIPVLGPILFQHNILVYLAFILVFISAFVLYKTTFGLKIMAVGDNPQAADSLGVNVYSIRYICVIVGSMLIGFGGAYVPLAYVPLLQENVTAGRGWIALALVTFGRWDPYKLLGGVLLFSIADSLQLRLQTLGVPIPYQFLLMTPYILTLLVMMTARRATRPAALAKPYKRE